MRVAGGQRHAVLDAGVVAIGSLRTGENDLPRVRGADRRPLRSADVEPRVQPSPPWAEEGSDRPVDGQMRLPEPFRTALAFPGSFRPPAACAPSRNVARASACCTRAFSRSSAASCPPSSLRSALTEAKARLLVERASP